MNEKKNLFLAVAIVLVILNVFAIVLNGMVLTKIIKYEKAYEAALEEMKRPGVVEKEEIRRFLTEEEKEERGLFQYDEVAIYMEKLTFDNGLEAEYGILTTMDGEKEIKVGTISNIFGETEDAHEYFMSAISGSVEESGFVSVSGYLEYDGTRWYELSFLKNSVY